MADATGETKGPLRVAFDRRVKLEFHGARITSDGGLLAYRELDDTLGLTATGVSVLAEGRRGKNIRHRLLGLLRQAVYGRLAGYEDVNDAERLAHDPAMRAIVGREGIDRPPRTVRGLPAGRGGSAARRIRRDPAPDRPLARAARCGGLTGADHGSGQCRGENHAPKIDQWHQSRPG